MDITRFTPTGIELGKFIDTVSRNKSITKTEILLFLHSFSSFTPGASSADVHQLLPFLSHPHPHVRKATCDLFRKLQSAETAQVLAGALAPLVIDPIPAVRAAAWPAVVAACAKFPEQTPMSLFEKACGALQDEFDIVRKEALPMIALWGRHTGGASEAYPEADRAFLHISTTATDMSRFVRQGGFRQLASLPVPGVTFPTLHLSLFKKVARAASALAGKVGGAGGAGGKEDDAEGEDVDQALLQSFAAGALVHGLEDEFWQVRSEALRTLASFCQRCSLLVPPAVVHFVDALNDDNLRIRTLATDSLLALAEGGKLEMAEEQTRIVMRTLESASWRVRKGALQLLGRLRYATEPALRLTAGALVEHLDKRSTDEACTLGALAHMGGSHGGLADDMWTKMRLQIRASLASERGLSRGSAKGLLVLIGAAACARPSLADKIPFELWGHLRLLKRKVPGNYLVGVGKKRRVDVGESGGVGFGGGMGRNEPSNVAETIEMCFQTAFGVLPLVERGEGKEAAEVLRQCKGQLERIWSVHLASETAIRFALLEIEALGGMVAIRLSTSALLHRGKGKAELREIQLAGGKIERIVVDLSARYKNLGADQALKLLELRLVAATCRFLGSEIEGYDAMSYDLPTRKELNRRRGNCLELMGRIRTFCDSHRLYLPTLVNHLELPPISERENNTTLATISMSTLARYWPKKTSSDRSMTRLWGTVTSPFITSGKAEFVRGMPLCLSVEVVVYNVSVGDRLLLKFEFGLEGLGVEYRSLEWGDLGSDNEIEQEPSYEELPLGTIKRCRINKTFVLYRVPLEPFPLRCSLGIESNIEEVTSSMTSKRIVSDWFGEVGPKNVVVRVSDFCHIHLVPTTGQAG